jgi:proliferating cell nuclear antigen
MNNFDNCIFGVTTSQPYPVKVLVESIKDILTDIPVNMTPGDGKDILNNTGESSDDDSDQSSDSDAKSKKKTVVKKKINKTVKKKSKKVESDADDNQSSDSEEEPVKKKPVSKKKNNKKVTINENNESSEEESEEKEDKKKVNKKVIIDSDDEDESDELDKKQIKKKPSLVNNSPNLKTSDDSDIQSSDLESSDAVIAVTKSKVKSTKKKIMSYSSKGTKNKKGDVTKVKNTNIEVTPKKKKGRPKKSDQMKSLKKKNDDDKMEDETPMKGGIKIIAVNSAKSVLVYIKLPAKNFDVFICRQEELTIGLNLPNFHKFIKTMEKDSTLILYMEKDDKNHLGIRMDNAGKKKHSIFKLNLLDMDKEKLEFTQAEFESYIRMPAQDFQQTCKNMHNISEYVDIKSVGKQLIFTCEGDIGSHTEIYGQKEKGLKVSNEKDIVQGIYELKHLVAFTKCTPLCDNIEIYMRNDYPLIIRYTIPTLGDAFFCLSPMAQEKNNDQEEDNKNNKSSDDN